MIEELKQQYNPSKTVVCKKVHEVDYDIIDDDDDDDIVPSKPLFNFKKSKKDGFEALPLTVKVTEFFS